MFEGVTICAGVALGPIRFAGYEFDSPATMRIPTQQVEDEIHRFHSAVGRSRDQVSGLSKSLRSDLGQEEGRILDVHLAYLEDTAFLQDVEAKIREEQLQLEGALYRVVRDFDRIFELVEDERLKERALDLRDVALRVIRNIEKPGTWSGDAAQPYVLATHKLSIADMFNLDHERVLGVIAEEGGAESHAGILARSMRIPTLSGIRSLRERLRDDDFVILDAATGVVHVNPDEELRRKYEVQVGDSRGPAEEATYGTVELSDGEKLQVLGSCGNLGDVSHAMTCGLDGIGLYRTELLFLVERAMPDEDKLVNHYTEVMSRAEGKRVCFRLLDDVGDLEIPGRRRRNEPNPALGLKGVRVLLAEQSMFRLQLRSLLRLAPSGTVELAVPFVTSLQDLQRVRAVIREEHAQLVKKKISCADNVRMGALIEVPAAALHLGHIAGEADFLIVGLDDLQQFILAADRDNLRVAEYYRYFHPALFKLVAQIAAEARELDRELTLFGEGAADPLRLPFYVGVGIRHFSVSPARASRVGEVMAKWSVSESEKLAQAVLEATTALEVQRKLYEAER